MYVLISILCFYISYRLFKVASGDMSLSKLNMISTVYYFHLLLPYFLSSILIVYNLDNHYLIDKLSNQSSRIVGYCVVNYTVVFLPIGMLITNKIWGANPKYLFSNYCNKSLTSYFSLRDSYIRYPLYLLSLISIASVAYTFITIGTIPLTSVFSGRSTLFLSILRNEVGREFAGVALIKDLFAITFTPIMSYTAYAYYKKTGLFSDHLWFIVMFLFSILILTYNLAKAPVIFYLLGFMFFNILMNKEISRRTLLVIFGSIIFLLITMYILLFSGDINFFNIASGPLGRVFFTQSAGLYLTIDSFPNFHGFLGFNSFSNLLSILMGEQHLERSARLLQDIYNHSSFLDGSAGVMNSLFVAEAYANFGILGVFLSPIYVGFVIQNFYIILLKLKKTPLFIAIFTYFSLRSIVNGGFNDFIYNPLMSILIIITIAIVLFSAFLKKYTSILTKTKNIPTK